MKRILAATLMWLCKFVLDTIIFQNAKYSQISVMDLPIK